MQVDHMTYHTRSTRLDEAQDATESLTDVVNGVLDTTQSIRQRLEQSNLPVQLKHQSAPSALENTMIPTEDDASTIRPARTTWASDAMTAVGRDSQYGFAFESDLRSSRVYSRVMRSINHRRSDPDQISLPSSAGFSMGSSFLSGVSLGDISNISLISFPIPLAPVNSNTRSTVPRAIWLRRRYNNKTLPRLPQPNGKIALLGMHNHLRYFDFVEQSSLLIHVRCRNLERWEVYNH